MSVPTPPSSSEVPRFRFAPTPSRPLHAGSALAALFGWAKARSAGGRFILRIEDIDRARTRPAFEEAVYRELAWLGLDWDEGPDVGGPFGPYRQSDRLALYDRCLDDLRAAGLAYVCTCSRADIRAAQSAPHLGAAETPYPGTCRGKGLTLLADRGGLRLDVAALDPVVRWRDGELGPQEEDVRLTSGDVLLGRAGQPTYQLAVVLDDRAMQVSDVVRGRDLLDSTARQILLHAALARMAGDARPAPRFHHHPLLVDVAGKKLSKRDEAPPLAELATTTDPAVLIAALGRAIGLFPASVARAAPADWAEAMVAHGPLSDSVWSVWSVPPVAMVR